MAKRLKVTQVKSKIGGKPNQRETLRSLGLKRIGDIIVIAQENLVLLDPERADKEGAMVGHHGGDSDIESQVGLLTTTLS